MSRLPSVPDALKIMNAASGFLASEVEKKAKNNLLKSLNWAYTGLSNEQKQSAATAYTKAKPPNGVSLANVLLKANRGTVTGDEVTALVSAILSANGSLAFSLERYVEINPSQAAVFGRVLDRFRDHLDAINRGDHNNLLDLVFLNVSLEEGAQEATRDHVKLVFQHAYAIVNQWYQNPADRLARIKIDTTLASQNAGGLSKQTGLELSATFYNEQSLNYTANKRLSVLVHESTHSIQDNAYVTDDAGGYIGSGSFQNSKLPVRLKNASHYQYVIERILKMDEIVPTAVGLDQNVIEAKQIVKNAWVFAINTYTSLIRYSEAWKLATPSEADQKRVEALGKLFGLPIGKDGGYLRNKGWKSPEVTVSDLAGIENRVGKLGLFLGAVEQAAESLPVNDRTRENILLKLVEIGGPIRKSSNPAKTIAMMKVAAMNCHQVLNQSTNATKSEAMQKFTKKQYDAIPQVDYPA